MSFSRLTKFQNHRMPLSSFPLPLPTTTTPSKFIIPISHFHENPKSLSQNLSHRNIFHLYSFRSLFSLSSSSATNPSLKVKTFTTKASLSPPKMVKAIRIHENGGAEVSCFCSFTSLLPSLNRIQSVFGLLGYSGCDEYEMHPLLLWIVF